MASRSCRLLLAALLVCLLSSYAYAGDRVLFYHNDTLGSPVVMTDMAGNVTWRADYEPFGEISVLTDGLQAPNTHQFIGKETDLETSLHYLGARYYDGNIGRFLSVDPALLRKGPRSAMTIPQRLNVYVYATNNPYRYFDPDGKYTIVVQGFSSSGISNWFGAPGVVGLASALESVRERTSLVQHDANLKNIISQIRAASERGEPINIVGHSLGGATAKELAQKLDKIGIPVNYLGLIDTYGDPNISGNVIKNKTFRQKGLLGGDPSTEDPASPNRIVNKEIDNKSHLEITGAVTPEIVKDITGVTLP